MYLLNSVVYETLQIFKLLKELCYLKFGSIWCIVLIASKRQLPKHSSKQEGYSRMFL